MRHPEDVNDDITEDEIACRFKPGLSNLARLAELQQFLEDDLKNLREERANEDFTVSPNLCRELHDEILLCQAQIVALGAAISVLRARRKTKRRKERRRVARKIAIAEFKNTPHSSNT
jgi:hypothetical protein